jgi:hypothetical protein
MSFLYLESVFCLILCTICSTLLHLPPLIFPALEDARTESRKVAMPALSSSHINADLKSMRAAAQVVSAVMGREQRRKERRKAGLE